MNAQAPSPPQSCPQTLQHAGRTRFSPPFPSCPALLSPNSLEHLFFFFFWPSFEHCKKRHLLPLLLFQLAVIATTPCERWVPVVQKMMEMRNPGFPAAEPASQGLENLLGLLNINTWNVQALKLHERLLFMQNKALFK